jgi:hypothetical protein
MNSFIDLNIQPILQSFSAVNASKREEPGGVERREEKAINYFFFLSNYATTFFYALVPGVSLQVME